MFTSQCADVVYLVCSTLKSWQLSLKNSRPFLQHLVRMGLTRTHEELLQAAISTFHTSTLWAVFQFSSSFLSITFAILVDCLWPFWQPWSALSVRHLVKLGQSLSIWRQVSCNAVCTSHSLEISSKLVLNVICTRSKKLLIRSGV